MARLLVSKRRVALGPKRCVTKRSLRGVIIKRDSYRGPCPSVDRSTRTQGLRLGRDPGKTFIYKRMISERGGYCAALRAGPSTSRAHQVSANGVAADGGASTGVTVGVSGGVATTEAYLPTTYDKGVASYDRGVPTAKARRKI